MIRTSLTLTVKIPDSPLLDWLRGGMLCTMRHRTGLEQGDVGSQRVADLKVNQKSWKRRIEDNFLRKSDRGAPARRLLPVRPQRELQRLPDLRESPGLARRGELSDQILYSARLALLIRN